MSPEMLQIGWVQGGFAFLLIGGAAAVIWHMWQLINRLLVEAKAEREKFAAESREERAKFNKESREDRQEFVAALNSTNRVTEANATSLALHTSAVHALREAVDDMNSNLERLIDRTGVRDRGN